MCTTHVTLICLLLFTLASCQTPAVGPKLHLYNTALTPEYLDTDFGILPGIAGHTISDENNDITGNAELITILNNTRSYCVDGVWRFFPEPEFMANPSSDYPNGFTIGEGQYRLCKNTADAPQQGLASMKSYRYLGALDWETEYSMTVYEGYFYSGRNISVFATLQRFPEPNSVDVDFEVKSLVITAPNNTADPTENQNRIMCSSWLVNILDNPSFNFNACYNLCSCPNAPAGDLPKMFMVGSNLDHAVNYLRFAQYNDASEGGAQCDGVIIPPASAVVVIVPPPTTPCA